MSASELQKAVDKLIKREPGWKAATQPPNKGPKPGKVATGYPASPAGQQSGGVAFVESDYTQREYWPAINITSSDGLFVLSYQPIKSVLLEGGDRATFKQPV